MVLFNGIPGYQFAAIQHILAVNPPGSQQILLLDISGKQPQKLNMLETARFRETAVFAATPHHLYRIAGTWIMCGSLQNGHFVEEATATAHKNQTWFQASPSSETIAGYHRVFAENRFFLWHNGQNYDILIPPLQTGESLVETAVSFTPNSTIFNLQINQHGSMKTAVYHVSHQGKIQHQTNNPASPSNLPANTIAAIHHTQGIISHNLTEIWHHPGS
jgi:hypothetical protein